MRGINHSRSRGHCDGLMHAAACETGFYNERVLDYLHFVFCLCLLERLLLTRKGRELFPVKTKGGIHVINALRGPVRISVCAVLCFYTSQALSSQWRGC